MKPEVEQSTTNQKKQTKHGVLERGTFETKTQRKDTKHPGPCYERKCASTATVHS